MADVGVIAKELPLYGKGNRCYRAIIKCESTAGIVGMRENVRYAAKALLYILISIKRKVIIQCVVIAQGAGIADQASYDQQDAGTQPTEYEYIFEILHCCYLSKLIMYTHSVP